MISTASPHPNVLEPSAPPPMPSSASPPQNANNAANINVNSMLNPISTAAYLEMASRTFAGNQPSHQLDSLMPGTGGSNAAYASALAAAAYQQQERQHQLFSAMCGAVLNNGTPSAPAGGMTAPPNPLAAMLANPATAALMAPHLMAACFREEPKPPHSYIGLIAMAILSSPEKKMVLSDIYQWILDHYPYFRSRGPGWRNSIRHNLSLNDCFVKVGRSANGKGHFWAIHPANLSDFQRGDFRRKKAQKRIKKHMGIIDDDEDDDECMMNGENGLLGLSDEDCDPHQKTSPILGTSSGKSSLSMSPAERFSEFLMMKSGGGGAAIAGLDDHGSGDAMTLAARLAMRLSGNGQQNAQLSIGQVMGLLGTNAGTGQSGMASGSQHSNSSASPVQVVSDDDEGHAGSDEPTAKAGQIQNHLNRLISNGTISNQHNDDQHSGAKKRRIFDIDSILAHSS